MDFLIQLDESILIWIQSLRLEWMTPFWKAVTMLGDHGWFWIVLALGLMAYSQTRKAGFTTFLAVGIGALVTNVFIKPTVARARPYEVVGGLERLIGEQVDFSFPSGHSCAAFAASVVCFRLLPRRYGVSLFILAALVACSRLYLGVHYPSDVLGGVAVGVASGWAACRIMRLPPACSR